MNNKKYYLILSAAILVSGLFIFISNVSKAWQFTVDDTYIFLRYAQNFAKWGELMAWNIGEAPVAGDTSFSWVLISAIPFFLKIDPIIFVKILGTGFVLLSAAMIFLLSWRALKKVAIENVFARYLCASFAAASLLIVPSSAIHAVSGMETTFFTFLLALFFFLLFDFIDNQSKYRAVALFLIAFLTGITRPEGNLMVVVSVIIAAAFFKSFRKKNLIYLFSLCYFLPITFYHLWRWSHFGDIFPNPFYIKVISTDQIFAGKVYVISFVKYVLLYMGPVFLLGFLKIKKEFLPMLFSTLLLVIFYIFPLHMMNYNFRYFFPIFPIIRVFTALGLANLLQCFDTNKKWAKLVFIGIIATALAVQTSYTQGVIEQKLAYNEGIKRAHVTLGKILYEIDSRGSRTLAVSDAGAVPYYSNWRAIDMFGLNDNYIAHLNKSNWNREYVKYIFNQKPHLIILLSGSPDEFKPIVAFESAIYEQAVKIGMKRIDAFSMDPSYYLLVLGDPGEPIAKQLLDRHYPERNLKP